MSGPIGNKNALGNKMSEDHKKKLSLLLKGKKRKPFSEETKNKMSLSRKKRITKDSTKQKMRERMKGERNPAWLGGITSLNFRIRNSVKYLNWRQSIFLRDNFTCQECGQRGGEIHAHHIKPFIILLKEAIKYLPLLNEYDAAMLYNPLWLLDNGIVLCENCHRKTFNKKMEVN